MEKSGGKSLVSFYEAAFKPSGQRVWFLIFAAVILSAYLYAFLEWLFFITQPSYTVISTNLWIKLSVFLFSGLVIAMAFGAVIAVLFLLYLLVPAAKFRSILLFAARLVLAFLLACLSLLLIDNFTYTLFKTGIITSRGLIRLAYGVLFLALIAVIAYKIYPHFNKITKSGYRKRKWQIYTAYILLLLSLVSVLTSNLDNEPVVVEESSVALTNRPNILLIGSDGLGAQYMSVYGYQRDTTPNLEAFAREALVAENAYSNGTSSPSSITSMLTGKLPTTTRAVHPPDILTGQDALEHLPGILKDQGYRNIEIAMPYFIDAYAMNMQHSFDIVNNRSIENYPILYSGWRIGGDYPFTFISITIERIATRLEHILFIKAMGNPYAAVTTGLEFIMSDHDRADQAISLLQTSSDPLFIHLHFTGTHGPYYYPEQTYFSKSTEQAKPFDPDLYDDSTREFDRYFGEIVNALENLGIKENTIIIIYSDHGKDKAIERLPWLIRFPNGEHAGTIKENVQNLDFAPTLLDYLNLPIPAWMEGSSVLSSPPPQERPIFVSSVAQEKVIYGKLWNYLDTANIKPPFYQFGAQELIVCNQVYEVNLNTNTWSTFTIPGHTAPCDPITLPTLDQARIIISEHLAKNGFDVRSIVK